MKKLIIALPVILVCLLFGQAFAVEPVSEEETQQAVTLIRKKLDEGKNLDWSMRESYREQKENRELQFLYHVSERLNTFHREASYLLDQKYEEYLPRISTAFGRTEEEKRQLIEETKLRISRIPEILRGVHVLSIVEIAFLDEQARKLGNSPMMQRVLASIKSRQESFEKHQEFFIMKVVKEKYDIYLYFIGLLISYELDILLDDNEFIISKNTEIQNKIDIYYDRYRENESKISKLIELNSKFYDSQSDKTLKSIFN